MERKDIAAVMILLLIYSAALVGNDRLAIYQAYISDNMQAWKAVIDRIQQEERKSSEKLLTLVNYQYGYIGWCIGKNRKEEAESYIGKARENLAELERNGYGMSLVNAYKSALYGYEIGISKVKAPFIGPKSVKHAELALQLDPSNPFAYMQMGYVQFYMPPVFGGSKNEAIGYFLKAKTGMEMDRDKLRNDWNYLHLLTLIAQAYNDLGDRPAAKRTYEIILKIEPGFLWIKNEMYPQISKQFEY